MLKEGFQMYDPDSNVVEILQKNNIKPSYARIRIFEYLTVKNSHPTVDEIYNALAKDIPTLSKTTVYNTLDLFIEKGLARIINIEENETRYDAIMSNHGHFKCESCGKIYDFNVDIDSLKSADLNNFKINDKNVYFKGICPRCLSSINEIK
jgi:Fur family peroxide stress response transcriptional regulator